MLAACQLQKEELMVQPTPANSQVTLASGQRASLVGLSREALQALQWEEEQQFARAIQAAPKGSSERARVIGRAYDTICTILSAQAADAGEPLVMGLDRRYVRLVLQLLRQQREQGHPRPLLFEVGYGCGALLAHVLTQGYTVSGIEVSSIMRAQAVELLGQRHASSLLLGDLRRVDAEALPSRPTLIYWNDVLEHIPPDELSEYLATIYGLMATGGTLVTITPHWLLRPSDVTGDFCPPRTEARGLHLKEYRLAELAHLLRQAGFRRVTTPLLATHRRLVVWGGGARRAKQWIEPVLDRLPVRAAHLACRGLAMNATIAWK
jgi:hypothetical protein